MAKNYNQVLQTLHRMHRQFAELMDRLNRGPRKIAAAQQRLAELAAEKEQAIKRVIAMRIATDEKQAMLDNNEKNLARRRNQLLEAKNNTEYDAIRSQIAADEASNAVMSDEILESLDRLDALKTLSDEASRSFVLGQELLEKIKSDMAVEKQAAEEEIRRIKVDFYEEEKLLGGEHHALYHRTFKGMKFDTLAKVEGTSCQGCHTRVTLEQIAVLAKGETPVSCLNCGRMLYLTDGHHV